MLQEQEKSCALSHNRDWGRDGIIPDPLVAAPMHKAHCESVLKGGPAHDGCLLRYRIP
jgi:hypothetical protein